MMRVFGVLGLFAVLVVTKAVKEDVKHGAQHGKQPLMKDGHHNVHFDHEAILGSYKLEQEFDEMEPEEAKKRLALLVKKIDKDQDGFVTKEELTQWILMSFRLLDEEEAVEEMEEKDENSDGMVTWPEYLQAHFSYSEEDIKKMRKEDRGDVLDFLKSVDDEERKFMAADVDKSGSLDKKEYMGFVHPHSYEHMQHLELERTLAEHDKDKDGFLSMAEFIGDANDHEFKIVEEERFREFDTNKDGVMNVDEMRPWVLTDNEDEAKEEADHLIHEADKDEDGKLSEAEIIDEHDAFVGSQITDFGRHLHFVKHNDEL